ncbi:MAG: hypothetical protein ACKVRO_06800 [Micropepsaceae bacterium]
MPMSNDPKATGTFAERLRKLAERRAAESTEADATRPHAKRQQRESVFANATLVHASGKLPAVVKNMNAVGARVEFTTHVTLQGDVVIVAPTLGLNNRVRVAWQQGGSAGLIFAKREQHTG